MDTVTVPPTNSQKETAFLYLLLGVDRIRFKIGFSIDPFQRLKSFETKIDTASSLQVSCSIADIRRLERAVHTWFDDFRLPSSVVNDGDGSTEWFNVCCWDQVVRYLHEHHDWLRCSIPAPLDVAHAVHLARRRVTQIAKRNPCLKKHKAVISLERQVCSMADLMSQVEAELQRSIIGEEISVCDGLGYDLDEQNYVFGRLLWELGALHQRGIIKLGRIDLSYRSFKFTLLSEEPFDTKSLYAFGPAAYLDMESKEAIP